MEDWLLLTDYASKYRVSVSTLRRRIKSGLQAHKFEAGRYFLPDHVNTHSELKETATKSKPLAQVNDVKREIEVESRIALKAQAEAKLSDEPLITTTTKLLTELKQAYTLILHEKEEQIVYLKEEIADLKTLVRVLESENARQRDQLARNQAHTHS